MPNTESQTIEFKQELSESFESEVIAFLNSKTGGHIYIGIADEGTVLGVKNLDLVQRQIANITKTKITPMERKEANLVDPIALREAIVNAVVHI